MGDVQICFLVDMHDSMEPFVGAIKDQIESLVNAVQTTYPLAALKIAFIGYGGYHDIPFITKHEFTDKIKYLQKVLHRTTVNESLTSSCRDVQEGYAHALFLQWTARFRILFHMANAPAFGTAYHEKDVYDLYPIGHSRFVLEKQMKDAARHGIDIVLFKLNNNMNKMIDIMEENYYSIKNYGFYVVNLVGARNAVNTLVRNEMMRHILHKLAY